MSDNTERERALDTWLETDDDDLSSDYPTACAHGYRCGYDAGQARAEQLERELRQEHEAHCNTLGKLLHVTERELANIKAGRDAQKAAADAHYDELQRVKAELAAEREIVHSRHAIIASSRFGVEEEALDCDLLTEIDRRIAAERERNTAEAADLHRRIDSLCAELAAEREQPIGEPEAIRRGLLSTIQRQGERIDSLASELAAERKSLMRVAEMELELEVMRGGRRQLQSELAAERERVKELISAVQQENGIKYEKSQTIRGLREEIERYRLACVSYEEAKRDDRAALAAERAESKRCRDVIERVRRLCWTTWEGVPAQYTEVKSKDILAALSAAPPAEVPDHPVNQDCVMLGCPGVHAEPDPAPPTELERLRAALGEIRGTLNGDSSWCTPMAEIDRILKGVGS